MIRLGVTGTQRGLTDAQAAVAEAALDELRARGPVTLLHGDCVGVDAQLARLARRLGCLVAAFPPSNPSRRAYVPSDITYPPAPYLARNRSIVAASAVMWAFPGEAVERLRSGTWATVRYARRAGRPLRIVGPDGADLAA